MTGTRIKYFYETIHKPEHIREGVILDKVLVLNNGYTITNYLVQEDVTENLMLVHPGSIKKIL